MTLEAVEPDPEPGPEPGGKQRKRRRRKRRRQRADGVGTFGSVLPSLLTTGNIAAGFYAIVKASTGDPVLASYMIFVAAIFDILDGRAARLTHSESRFGAEYDSIADTVSFAVAPAIIAFHAGDFAALRWAGWVLAFVYVACASLRLARFNVSTGRYKGRFDGLPSPAAAGMTVSTVWFGNYLQADHGIVLDLPPLLLALGLAGVGVLMVSPFPYRSFKDVNVRGSYRVTVVMVIISIVLLIEPGLNFFILGLAYCLHGPAEWFWRNRTGRPFEALISDDPMAAAAAANEDAERGA